MAYLPNGTVGARFSDSLKLDFDDKKQMEAFKEHPMHYENQFDVASGKYNLESRVCLRRRELWKGGDAARDRPLRCQAIQHERRSAQQASAEASDLGTGLDALLLEDRVPLIADGMQLVPYGSNHFKKGDLVAFYTELYEPLLVTGDPKTPPVVAFDLRVLDGKTGEQKARHGLLRVGLACSKGQSDGSGGGEDSDRVSRSGFLQG